MNNPQFADEDALRTHSEKYLRKLGFFVAHVPRQASKKGSSHLAALLDNLIIGYGRQFWIEYKNPNKSEKEWVIGDKQAEFMLLLQKNKVPWLLSNDWAKIKEFIDIMAGG